MNFPRSMCAALVLICASASANTITIPAVASFRGRATYTSDVTLYNRSYTASLSVTATYRCSMASCGQPVQTLTLAPRQQMLITDIVGTLFQAPNTQGAIVFDADGDTLSAESRLNSLEESGPATAQVVPGLADDAATSVSVILNVGNSSDPTTGSRTNIVAFNPSPISTANVVFRLFDSSGLFLGSFNVALAPVGYLPAVAIFPAAGVAQDVGNAVCAVSSDQPLFVGASILDNSSGSATFHAAMADDAPPLTNVIVATKNFCFNDEVPIQIRVGRPYSLTFHCLDNGANGAGHGFGGIFQLGLAEFHNITTAADYTTAVFTPQMPGSYVFECSSVPGCGQAVSTAPCEGGHRNMTGTVQVDP